MKLFDKSLSQLVGEITEKEKKVLDKINETEDRIESINEIIKESFNELVEYELEDDKDNQNRIENKIKQYRNQLVNLEGMLGGYKNNLNSLKVTPSQLEEIKKVAKEEEEGRLKEYEDLKEKEKKIELKIEAEIKELELKLEKEKDKLWAKRRKENAHERAEKELLSIIRHVDPLAPQLDRSDQKRFINNWIYDIEERENYFYRAGLKKRPVRPTVTIYPTNLSSEEENATQKELERQRNEKREEMKNKITMTDHITGRVI